MKLLGYNVAILRVMCSLLFCLISNALFAQVSIYEHCNYAGYSITLPEGRHDLASLIQLGIHNDDISSIRVSPGYRATFFEDENFQGRSYAIFSGQDSCLVRASFNDKVSSISIEWVGEGSWTPPSGQFPFFDELTKSGGIVSTGANPPAWLTSAVSDWMGRLPDSTQLSDISIPGTHDSGSLHGGTYCQTQSWTIDKMLNAGIRYLDIRNRRVGDAFTIHHGACYQHLNFDDVMQMVQNFLQAHPGETILMRVKEEHTPVDGSESFQQIWSRYMEKYGHLFVTDLGRLPNMGEARGKVVVLRNAGFTGYGVNMYGNSKIVIQDKYKVFLISIGDAVSLSKKKQLVVDAINVARSGNTLVLNHLSGTVMTPLDVAKGTHAAAFKEIGSDKGTQTVGALLMDYPGPQLVYRIIKSNFKSPVQLRDQ